jgi:sugar phosphate isomerase/epimerase
MKIQFNLTTSIEDMKRFDTREDLLDLMNGFDGVELMQFEDDERGIIPKDRVIGLHMGYFPYWIDFWNGNLEAVRKEFDTLEAAYQYYGGSDRSAIINRYRKDLEYAHHWGAEYVVFHVSEATIAETFHLKYRHTDEEMIDATIELLNELFAEEDGSIALLMENLWQPGLTFLRPEMTQRLMDGVKYPNKGIMLDTGHLLHTNLKLRTQEEGLAYIHSLLNMHGDLCRYIRGMHLNQSLTGEYMKQTMLNPPDLSGSYADRIGKMFWHAFAVDKHLPFTCEGVDRLVERISPEYLTFEFITADSAQHRQYLDAQRHALKSILTGF